jgi:hypothetical protein
MKKKTSDKASGIAIESATDDVAMDRVLKIQEKYAKLEREVKALRKDRDDMLSEYSDIKNARKFEVSPAVARRDGGGSKVRVCAGDFHGMMTDKQAVAAFVADVKRLDPDEVVIGGDLVECGGWLAKHQPVGFIALCDYSYQEDIAAANCILDEIQKAAPNAAVHYLEGNHEDRMERWIVDQVMSSKRDAEFLVELVSPRSLLKLKERGINYYRRSEIYGKGLPRGWIKLGKMFFTHSLTYSANAARDAASKTAGNVTYFCTHREDSATIVYPEIGIVKAFNPGCMSLMQPVWKHSNPTSWSQGYGIDFIAPSGNFQRIHVPIWGGESLAGNIIDRFKS